MDDMIFAMMIEDEISHKIIGCAIEVHRELGGPGLFESVYEAALCHELTLQGLKLQRQLQVPVKYKGELIKEPFCLDLLIENKIIVEIKSVEEKTAVHDKQLLTYLRLTGLRLGLIINFGKSYVKDGVHRIVNNLH